MNVCLQVGLLLLATQLRQDDWRCWSREKTRNQAFWDVLFGLWNQLPPAIQLDPSLGTFRNQLKLFFLAGLSNNPRSLLKLKPTAKNVTNYHHFKCLNIFDGILYLGIFECVLYSLILIYFIVWLSCTYDFVCVIFVLLNHPEWLLVRWMVWYISWMNEQTNEQRRGIPGDPQDH